MTNEEASFRVSVPDYRPGVAVLAEPCLTDDLKAAYDEVPEVVWLWLRRLFVTGRVGSVQQIQAHMKHVLMRDLREELIHAYIWKHQKDLYPDREVYLQTLHRRMLETDIDLCSDPQAERFQRITDNICMLLDAMITDAIDNNRWIQPKDVQALAKTLETLKTSSPFRASGKSTKTVGNKAPYDVGEFKSVLKRLIDTQAGQEAEADDTLRKYIDRTKDILEPEDDDD
jgi:hypothetical protein